MQHNENFKHQLHRKLGRHDHTAIRQMSSVNSVDDLKIVECNIKEFCETCVKGKLTRTSFPLQLVHSDVCGPMQTTTPSGKRYIGTFIDDYPGFTTLYLLSKNMK